MAYICHCDICDKRIEGINVHPHRWMIGEAEVSTTNIYPPYMDICDDCFPMFQEGVKNLLEQIKRWKEHRYA